MSEVIDKRAGLREGTLLDAWDDIPNDLKYDAELERIRVKMEAISDAMEGE